MDEGESTTSSSAVTWIRRGAALVFLLAGSLFAVAISMAAVWRENRPELALRLWPYDARALAASAGQQLKASGGADIDPATSRLLERALLRDATAVNAWRALGEAAYLSGERETGIRYLLISQSLSARDPRTQLWLIEDSAQRGDVDDALRHYDIALRTSVSTADLLLPTLVSATREPVLAVRIADLISQDPPWSSRFIDYFAQNAPSAGAATQLVAAVPMTARSEYVDSFKKLIPLLIERSEYEAAADVYALLSGGSRGGLRDTDFRGKSAFPPFEWDLTDTPDLRAERVGGQAGDSETGLRVFAANGAIATVARQLAILPPGRYRLTSRAGSRSETPVEGLAWRVSCAGSERELLKVETNPKQAAIKTSAGTFRVPDSGCAAQWLALEVTAPDTAAGSEAWIYAIGIERAAASPGAPEL